MNWTKILAVFAGVLLSFDNLPGLYQIAGLYTGAPALPFLLLGILFIRSPKTRGYLLFRAWTYGLLGCGLISASISLLTPEIQTALLTVTVDEEMLLVKGIKTFIIASTWILAVRLGYVLFRRDPRILVWLGVGLLAANMVGLLVQWTGLMSAGAVDSFHSVRWHEDRIRGFKFESSVFGASIIASAALLSLRLKGRTVWFMILPPVSVMVYLTTSRGALVAIVAAIVLSVVFLSLNREGRPLGYWIVLCIALIVVLGGSLFGFVFVTSPLWAPLSAAGSDATRSGWGLVALQSLGSTPIGLNVINYWLEVRQLIGSVNAYLQPSFGAFNLTEFSYLVYSDSDSGLSPKSLPAVLGVWFGLPGLIWGTVSLAAAAANASIRWTGRVSSPDIFILATLMSLVLFVPGIFIYETALVLGAALSMKVASVHPLEENIRASTDPR